MARAESPRGAEQAERGLLVASLERAREAVLARLAGVPVVLLGEPLVSPHSSLLGVVKDLTRLERWWLSHTFAGGPDAPDAVRPPPIGSRLERSDTASTIIHDYHAECARGRSIIRHSALDDLAARPLAGGDRVTLRWILLHLIEETSRRAGHADVLRHLIDGTTTPSTATHRHAARSR